MKKFNISFLIIMLCSILIFTGCTKAKNATPEKVTLLYDGITEKYSNYSGSTKTKIFNSQKNVDLYSSTAYDLYVYNQITSLNGDASTSLLNVLAKGAEYETIITGITSFYYNRSIVTSFIDIPQDLISELYVYIDDLDGILEKVLDKKEAFESTVINFNNVDINSQIILGTLKSYLKSYSKLIEQFYKINSLCEEIYTSYIYVPSSSTITLRQGELQRLVLSSALYIAEYYHQKQLVLNSNLENRFGYQKIVDSKSNTVVDNDNYDKGFENFKKIVENLLDVADPSNLNDPDYLSYYNAANLKLKTLKTNIKNYQAAVQKVTDYKIKNKTISKDSSVYSYVQFIEEMDTEIQSYQNYLMLNIMKIA